MPKRIIYPMDGGGVHLVIPSPEWLEGRSIEELAYKDVPLGKPYLIINAIDVPQKDETRPLWTADFSTPDGYGGKP